MKLKTLAWIIAGLIFLAMLLIWIPKDKEVVPESVAPIENITPAPPPAPPWDDYCNQKPTPKNCIK